MTQPRLEPIERPPTLLARIAAVMMRRQLGKVVTPAKVIYNRMPRMYGLMWQLTRVSQGGLELEPQLRLLVQSWVAMVNNCAFCVDIGKALALQQHLSLEKFQALPDWRTSPLFSDRERAALAYAEQANLERTVSDETFAALRKHFGERQIVEITFLVALENFYNLMHLPLGIEGDDGLCAIQQARQRKA